MTPGGTPLVSFDSGPSPFWLGLASVIPAVVALWLMMGTTINYEHPAQMYVSAVLLSVGLFVLLMGFAKNPVFVWIHVGLAITLMLAGLTWVLFLFQDTTTVADYHPALFLTGTIVALFVTLLLPAYAMSMRSKGPAAGTTVSHNLNASYFELLFDGLRYTQHVEVTTMKAQVEQNLTNMRTNQTQRVHLDETERTFAPEADAIVSAHAAAQEARIHPNVYHSPEYQLGKQQAELNYSGQTRELELEEKRLEMDLKFVKESEEIKRNWRREREEDQKAGSGKADNGKVEGPDIPDPERTTGD